MAYNPTKHHRQSIRLKGYDYSKAGLYFITICCQDRVCRFGNVENGEMLLNEYGQIAYQEWIKLPERFSNFGLDVFQIMPNHVHGIIKLNEPNAGTGFTPVQTPAQTMIDNDVTIDNKTTTRVSPAIPDIVGAYKSLVANECLKIYKMNNETMGKLWQRNYWDHIIKNEWSYKKISEYIVNNPANWDNDTLK